ncbi:hypothetical protein SLEP1_g11395 [Rubroshorea leprosula]|uniref:Uncharacterized protein n=1 Tax=Rubroshorea leprosula TaxID=152421 RepID=A0AAV5ILA7_9ROSI|nr:hypothetical protein SLEP1_g11395 [Rubroshorea leprosula]
MIYKKCSCHIVEGRFAKKNTAIPANPTIKNLSAVAI